MTERHWSWKAVAELISKSTPTRLAIDGNPSLDLVINGYGGILGLSLPRTSKCLPKSKLRFVKIDQKVINRQTRYFISTNNQRLCEDFYALLLTIADSVQIDKEDPASAIENRLENWKQLFSRVSLLTAEEELGLFGELWFLRELLRKNGEKAVDCWIGPLPEPHDFRFGDIEVEVKSTRNRQRLHIISSVDQLTPSKNKKLYLLSLQFAPSGPGAGSTLPEAITACEALLAKKPSAVNGFRALLERRWGYTGNDAKQYETRFQLRTAPAIVAVNSHCPALTKKNIEAGLGKTLAGRIVDVSYSINLEGLGVEYDSKMMARLSLQLR